VCDEERLVGVVYVRWQVNVLVGGKETKKKKKKKECEHN